MAVAGCRELARGDGERHLTSFEVTNLHSSTGRSRGASGLDFRNS